MAEIYTSLRALADNSTQVEEIEENNHLTAFLFNFGLLLSFMGVLLLGYAIFLFFMSLCERRISRRWKAARAQFVNSQLVVREWLSGCDDECTNASTVHETSCDEEMPPDANTNNKETDCHDDDDDGGTEGIGTTTSEKTEEIKPSRTIDDGSCTTSTSDEQNEQDDGEQDYDFYADDDKSYEDCETCVICLAPFENHERVCESNNPDCQHVFHEACMVSWLQKHNRCPVCRQPYLVDKHH